MTDKTKCIFSTMTDPVEIGSPIIEVIFLTVMEHDKIKTELFKLYLKVFEVMEKAATLGHSMLTKCFKVYF